MDTNEDFERPDGRAIDQLRELTFTPDFAPNADGSVLCAFGNTKVICAASIDNNVPRWMKAQGVKGGWSTAEYSMLPYSTLDRKSRDISRGKQDGRTVEIQRLIGRSLRAVLDLQKLGERTLWIDCDVLQADGGTRTAVPAVPTKPAGADRAVSEDGRRIRTFPCVFRVKRKKVAMRVCQLCQSPPKPLSGLRFQGKVLYLDGPRLFFEIGTDFGTHA